MQIWFVVFQEMFWDGTRVKEEVEDERTKEPEVFVDR
jgi:hypothetical protein